MSLGYKFLDDSGAMSGVCNILSTVTGIDATATGLTNLYTVPSGKTAIIIGAILRITALTAFVGVGTGGIGTNVTQDDIMSSRAMTGLNAVGSVFCFMNSNSASAIASSSSTIQLGIDVSFVAGTCTIALDLIGYLI